MHIEDEVELTLPVESDVQPAPKLDSVRPGKLFWLLLLALLLGTAQLGVNLWQGWLALDLLAMAWAILLLSGIVGVSWSIGREWLSFRKLEQREHLQQIALGFSQSPAIGEAGNFCRDLLAKMPSASQADGQNWLTSLEQHYADREVIQLFEQQVMAPADKRALDEISREAKASAALIAVSPFVMLDMLLVLWRNLRMINKICACYGVKTGYLSKIALLKKTVRTMLYAGASELLAEASAWALGGSLTAKLSTRVAQGLGAGVLTARFGVQALKHCRPLPFVSETEPKISVIASGVLTQFRGIDDSTKTVSRNDGQNA
ncbi:TIGR01620 family protein [Bowmanella yangjiangensis]|uniref:TIGR01620 family protein n=1 Tax=Bowmanella yangjiangensis TaxID=2811230 RepID=A0ABS3CUV8_9ALTE|nr:TIGR01620 family protein [Bowmanella yangjiangensis]MBN7820878.1 TIGR01620 family protein [Bowmanella yangjiangensis]